MTSYNFREVLFQKHSIIGAIRFLLILLFTYTAISKISDHALFEYQLHAYPEFKNVESFVSWVVPFSELLVVLLLLLPKTLLTGLYFSLCLLTVYTSNLIIMVLFEKNLPCSCGGVLKFMTWKEHILFNAFFLFITAAGIKLSRDNKVNRKVE